MKAEVEGQNPAFWTSNADQNPLLLTLKDLDVEIKTSQGLNLKISGFLLFRKTEKHKNNIFFRQMLVWK